MSGCKNVLAACLLLQSGCREGRIGMALERLGFDRGHGEGGGFKRPLESFGFGARADVEALQLLAVSTGEPRLEAFVARSRQRGDERPIFLTNEFLDFEFAVGD